MEYTENENRVLALMNRTNFKNLSKSDVVSIVSQLGDLRPEVAKQVLQQFPELVKLIQSSWSEYKEILENVISSDDESLKQVFSAATKDMDSSAQSRTQFFDLADKIHADLSKCLDNPELTSEERDEILSKEIEILKIIDKKDSEIRTHEADTLRLVDEKDSEKRQFNWGILKIASAVIVVGLGIGASILGSDINLKLPGHD